MRYLGLLLVGTVCFLAVMGSCPAADLRLSEGLKMAVEKSRDLKMALHDEDFARAESLTDRARMLPAVTASFSGTALSEQPAAIFGPNTVPVSQKDFLSYSLGIQQTVYDFQGNASRYEAGKVRAAARRFDTARVRNFVAIDFALTYFDLLESQKMIAVAERELERIAAHVKNTKALLEEGVVTRNDLLQSEVRLSDARQRLLGAVNGRAISAARLNNILSLPLNSAVTAADESVDESVDDASLPAITLEMAWQAAQAGRPEIKILDETLRSLDLDETARRAELFPRVTVRGGYDFTQNRYQIAEGNWSVTLGVGINIFNGGSTSAELQKLAAQRAKLREQREKIVEDIRLEVTRYILSAGTAREKILATKDAVMQAEENLRINRARYEEGVGTATEVLDAVTLFTVAETNYYRAVYEARKAEAAVLYATGRDLTEVYK